MKFFRNRIVRTLLGGLISLPYPGLGHILARRWAFGAGLLSIGLAIGVASIFAMSTLAPTPRALEIGGGLWALTIILSVIAAIDAARLLWRRDDDVRPPWPRSTWFATIVAVAVGAVAAQAFPRHWRSFSIPSAAMLPTLHVGDYVMADLHPFTPAMGDVIIFDHPVQTGTIYIKRIVGMPGDTVQMKGGRLHINGAVVPREPIDEQPVGDQSGAQRPVPAYRETLPGGAAHDILEIEGDKGFLDDTALFSVPAGRYFVMGDNRDNSTDSRVAPERGGVGFVPAGKIIGKAGTIFWSKDRSRIFAEVR